MGKINLKVVPSSSQDCLVGWLGKSLKVKVKAPPSQGKANKAVIELLATLLQLDKKSIKITTGQFSSSKVLLIEDLDNAQIIDALNHIMSRNN